MTRFSFNYKTASGVASLVLEKCTETFFKQFKLLGNSVQQETPSPDFPQEIKNAGKWNEEKQKYEVDVQVTGKNLLNLKKCNLTHFPGSNQKGEINDDKIILKGTRYSQFKVKVEKGKKYTLTAKFQSGNNPSIQCWSSYSEDSSNFNDFGRSYGSIIQNGLKEITFTSETDYLCLYFYPGSENEFVTYYELMICEQNLYDKIYEPYREPQTVKLSLDQPLRGIGEHKDEVTKDGVVRKIKQITLNGSEDWTLHNNTSKEKTQSFGLVIPVKCYAANVGLKSNRFLKRYTVWMGDIEGIDIYSGRTLYINIEKTKASNVEEFKKWLSENQVTVEVVLVEPIIEPLAEESKKALESLYTNNGTTVIAVDGGEVEAKIEVEYAVKE